MPGKTPSSYDLDEVGIFLTAIGLESKVGAFRENAVDGDMLVSLQPEDFEELGLSGLQAKKLVRSVQFAASLANDEQSKGADPAQLAALQKENANLKNENAALRAQLQEYTSPRPAPAPAPQQQHHHHQPAGRPVIRGAAGGAARGAVLGAVAGAIAGDPAQGAKMGAALGGTAGGMQGLGARRRQRMAGRY